MTLRLSCPGPQFSHLEKTCAGIAHFPGTVSLSCYDQYCPMSRTTGGHKGRVSAVDRPLAPMGFKPEQQRLGLGWAESLGRRKPGRGPCLPQPRSSHRRHSVDRPPVLGEALGALTPAACALLIPAFAWCHRGDSSARLACAANRKLLHSRSKLLFV